MQSTGTLGGNSSGCRERCRTPVTCFSLCHETPVTLFYDICHRRTLIFIRPPPLSRVRVCGLMCAQRRSFPLDAEPLKSAQGLTVGPQGLGDSWQRISLTPGLREASCDESRHVLLSRRPVQMHLEIRRTRYRSIALPCRRLFSVARDPSMMCE